MMETSGDDKQEEDIMVQLMFGTLCPPEDSSDGLPEAPIVGNRRRHHGAVDVWDALPAGRLVRRLARSANCWRQPRQGQAGRSIADNTTMDGVMTTATTEQVIPR